MGPVRNFPSGTKNRPPPALEHSRIGEANAVVHVPLHPATAPYEATLKSRFGKTDGTVRARMAGIPAQARSTPSSRVDQTSGKWDKQDPQGSQANPSRFSESHRHELCHGLSGSFN